MLAESLSLIDLLRICVFNRPLRSCKHMFADGCTQPSMDSAARQNCRKEEEVVSDQRGGIEFCK